MWNSQTSGASRHRNTRELPIKQKVNLHQDQGGDHIKRYWPVEEQVYIIVVVARTRFFRRKGQCVTEMQLFNTPHDRRRCGEAMTPLWCSSINTLCFPQKMARALSRLRGDMATQSAIALNSSFNLFAFNKHISTRVADIDKIRHINWVAIHRPDYNIYIYIYIVYIYKYIADRLVETLRKYFALSVCNWWSVISKISQNVQQHSKISQPIVITVATIEHQSRQDGNNGHQHQDHM